MTRILAILAAVAVAAGFGPVFGRLLRRRHKANRKLRPTRLHDDLRLTNL